MIVKDEAGMPMMTKMSAFRPAIVIGDTMIVDMAKSAIAAGNAMFEDSLAPMKTIELSTVIAILDVRTGAMTDAMTGVMTDAMTGVMTDAMTGVMTGAVTLAGTFWLHLRFYVQHQSKYYQNKPKPYRTLSN